MISKDIIDKILNTCNIVDVIKDFIVLKKRGVNYIGLCPFHNEKTSSFTVSPSKGIFKCFGCGKSGNSISFIMEHEQMRYPEALKYLAKKYNIEIEEDGGFSSKKDEAIIDERESLMVVTTYAQRYFSDILKNNKEGISVRKEYFSELRQFKDDIIEKFQLGYCLMSDDNNFTKIALKNGYKLDNLIKSGLTINNNYGNLDRFKGRVIFPIHSISGKVIAFGGRVLNTDNNNKVSKYINSPESPIYHKSNIVYGIYFAKKTIVDKDECYLVEGYTDVISMYQNGIQNVVASSGTSLTIDQIRLIKRFTQNITILYDGDIAGIKASFRGIDLILEEGMNVKVLLFPNNDDPDSFAKKTNPSELIKFINLNKKNFITFKTEILLSDCQNDPIKKAELIKDIVKSIAIIPDNIIRSIYLKECSKILNIEEQILYTEVNNIKNNQNIKTLNNNINVENNLLSMSSSSICSSSPYDIEEKEIIELILNYGNIILKFKDNDNKEQNITVAEFIVNELVSDDIELSNTTYKQLLDEYVNYLTNNNNKIPLDNKYFLNHNNQEIRELSTNILIPSYELSNIYKNNKDNSDNNNKNLLKIINKCLIVYKSKIIKNAEKELNDKIRIAQENNSSTEEEIDKLLEKITILANSKKMLSKISERVFS